MKVYYNGCLFDSKAELKYALSIEDGYAYIIHPKRIYDSYYREDGKIVEIYDDTKSYTPDFLIRSYDQKDINEEKNEAFFIEIKVESFEDKEQFERRNTIMEKYIHSLSTPARFNWVFWNDDKLPKEKVKKFNFLMANQDHEQRFYKRLRDIYRRNEKIPYTFPFDCSDQEYLDFLYNAKPFDRA